MKWTRLVFLGGMQYVASAELDIFNVASLSIGTFVNSETCYSAIEGSVSSKGGEKRMDQESYVDFVKAYGPEGFLEDTSAFEELPLILITNFYFLACSCEPDLEDNCEESCVGPKAGIETNGALSGDTPTDAEQSDLFLVCSQTSISIDRVIQSISPTLTPISSLKPSPTRAPVDDNITQEEVVVTYSVGIEMSDVSFDDYSQELIDAMNSLAPTVLQEMKRRQLRTGRGLQVDPTVYLPTSILDRTAVECPPNLNKPADRCEEILASVIVFFQPTQKDPRETAIEFQENLSLAISNGQLQEFVSSDLVYIIDKDVLRGPGGGPGNSSAGIAVGVVVGVGLVVAIAFFVSGRQSEVDGEVKELKAAPEDRLGLDSDPKSNRSKNKPIPKGRSESDATEPIVADRRKPKGSNVSEDLSIADEMSNVEGEDASSSNAGSSGWSSSAGIDSMNTGSADGIDFEKSSAATLPLIANPSNVKRTEKTEIVDTMNVAHVTRDDLDSAIEAGDWAAVGATAALLAAASDSQSYSSKSEQYTGTRSRSGSSVSSLDVARAAELDHLVDAGDWEGVVLAAAKFEGDEGKESLPSASMSGSDTRSNADTAGQTADSSIGSSKGLKRQEYRAIVEDLVQRVVPEEINNVDEMMLQFRGREDELVETLRTMQERAVAQKARSSSQRSAKQQAKLSSAAARTKTEIGIPAKSSKSIGIGQVSATMAIAKSLGTGEIESTKYKTEAQKDKTEEIDRKAESKQTQTALEAAIEAGDWDAVGEAAALLTDSNSLSSADTGEINRYADGVSTDGSSVAGSKNLADVADELEELIEAGDWTGVVQAASSKGASIGKGGDKNESKRMRRLKHLQEEQEALAQAEIWAAIAEQSKQESDTTNQGAVDAADWAISRSLNALVEAELSGINDQSTIGTDMESLPQESTKDDEDDESGNEV